MRCIHRKIAYQSRRDEFRLYPIGDVHIGNKQCEERRLKELVKLIQDDPMAYWIGLGDYAEFISNDDPRWDVDDLADWLFTRMALRDIARAEVVRFLEIVEPIKEKCLGAVSGNHEDSIFRHSEVDPYGSVIEGLADGKHAHRLDHRGMIVWHFKRGGSTSWPMKIFVTHGSGGGSSKGNAGNKLGKLAEQVDGVDLVIMGHLHDPDIKTMIVHRTGKTESKRVLVHAVCIPALCGDMKYAAEKDYQSLPTGWAKITITPDKQRIQTTLDVS
ncbi:hypothetical protein KKH23_05635 [Patescibacteria group bacterium]|nr:hypothetical protein [Patescibacteria group bacterium]